MIIDFRAIQLKRIDSSDLEMIRSWRNDPIIQKHMFYQEHISEEAQKEWFKQMDKTCNYYFQIKSEDVAIGVSHLSTINWVERSAEVGLYIHNQDFWGTHIPALSSLALLKFAFETLQMKKVRAKVQPENKEAIKYNESLGFVAVEDGTYMLETAQYFGKTTAILKK